MENSIRLRCLKKGSRPYYIVRLLKTHGEMERSELEKKIKNLGSLLTGISDFIILKNSKVSLPPNYNFVVCEREYSNYLHNKCNKYNSRRASQNEIEIPKLLETGGNTYL